MGTGDVGGDDDWVVAMAMRVVVKAGVVWVAGVMLVVNMMGLVVAKAGVRVMKARLVVMQTGVVEGEVVPSVCALQTVCRTSTYQHHDGGDNDGGGGGRDRGGGDRAGWWVSWGL